MNCKNIDDYNIDDLKKVIDYLNGNKFNEKTNNSYVNVKREKYFLDIPEIPQLVNDEIKTEKVKKNIVIDEKFITKLANNFILKYPKYIDYYEEVKEILIDYFCSKYPIEK